MRNDLIYTDNLRYCAFCGEEVHMHYSDCEPYYECDCDDAIEDRRITEQIRELENSRPVPKYYLKNSSRVEKLS